MLLRNFAEVNQIDAEKIYIFLVILNFTVTLFGSVAAAASLILVFEKLCAPSTENAR